MNRLDTLKKEPAKKKSAFIPNIKKIYQIRKTQTLIKFWKKCILYYWFHKVRWKSKSTARKTNFKLKKI